MPLDFAWPHHQPLVPDPLPTLRVSGSAAAALLEGSGWTLNDLSLAYSSTLLATEVRMEVPVAGREACSIEGCIGRNVLGVLPCRDPEYADEIVVLGAHYDHMGETPGGAVWAGANDNASGVAVLLEIARMWHENGYAPRRTVLFAAWDAEELGLIGSRHYVEQPIFPLDSTVAMLQLDMVGAGTAQLYIDGGGALEPMLLSLADQLGLETSTTNHGRSDHGPFLRAGVPANLLIWFGGDDSVLTYHRPVDVAGNIETPKLDAAGKLTHLALLSLAEVEPAVQELLAQRAGALGESNLQAFLATSSEARIAQDATWFTSFASLQPIQVELRADSLHVYPGGAVGRVFLDFDRPTADGEGSVHETIDWPVRFEYAVDSWRWAGPDLRARTPAAREGTGLSISHNPKAGGATEALERLAAERYAAIAGRLGFVTEKDVHLQLFESSAALRASTHFDVPDGTTFWAVPGAVKLVHPVDLEDTAVLDHALIHLLLLELGFPHGRPIWLWEGLPLLFEEVQTPYEVQTIQLVQLQEDLQEQTPRSGPAASWAAASALRETLAWESFGFALRQSGAICRSNDCLDDGDLDAALLEGFGMNSQAIQEYGLRVWRERLEAAQRELDDLMARRSAAWRSGDLAAFLNTVDASTPGLLVEQRLWFEAREHGEVQSLTFDAQPVFFTEDGLQANVTVMLELLDAEGASSTKTTRFHGRFRRTDQGLVWAGAPYESTQRQGILVVFPQGEQQLALRVLSLSGPILERVPGTLGLPSDLTYQVKIFTDEDAYQASLPPPSVSPTGLETWTQPGTTIKLYVPGGRASPELESVLGKALIRSALLQSGVDSEWLLRGLSLALSSEFDDGWSQSQTAQQFFELIKSEQETLRWALDQLPAEEELNREQNARVDALAWDTLRYLRRSYGDDALRDLLIRLGDEDSLRTALKDVTGLDLRAFQAAWWDSFAQGHTDPRWIEWMMAFQEQAVMDDVEYLSGESFAGRRAGSPESELAAAWIADQFKAYGLEPVVAIEAVTPDSMPPSSDADTDEPVERVKSYFQPVPLVYTELTSVPTLQFTGISSDFSERLAYKSEFTLPVDVLSGRGSVEGTLVWVLDETYGGMDLSGKVVIRPQVEAAAVEVQRAMEHGAAGLIIAGDAAGVIETLSKTPLPAAGHGQENIPVLVLTEPGFEKLRKALEITVGDLYNGPPAQVLDVEVQMQVPLTPPVETTSPNVLGLIEGSNPQLADQVVLLSAHYDHVGDEPAPGLCAELAQSSPEVGDQACSRNGLLRYPGANDDASGVAVLLEIARLWQASGYRPQRSVLFAVWTAQEPGELGSGHFIQNPPLPLENLHAVLHLDAVGGGTGYYLEAHYDWDLDAEPLFHLFTTEDLIEGRLARSAKPIHNDHSAFRDQGVPALILTWRGAYERNMPRGYDDPLEPSRLGISGRMVGLTAMMLAR
jgi:Zn-dependent M28 family amino/carboxypeptidase